ncbi:MAG TPA: serine/threonine-protein kinase, partial [Burkholderiaceae bacterium]|nr:serine/threonine-protein kinase [Burkholderiaceae bacterium]
MSGATGLQLVGAGLGLLVAAGVVVGLLPRLSGRNSWLVTVMLFAAGLAAAWAWSDAAAIAAVAVLFGQIGRYFGTLPPGAVPSTEVDETALPAPSVAADPALLAPAGPVTRNQPSSLGRYRIDRALGRGSMGMVYLGHDPQIDRPVAVKTLALAREFEGVELAEARTRFFREAEMAGRLQHTDIVTIFDAGEEQELAFIAMEFVNGRDLQAHTLAGRLLPVAVVLHTIARVATALAYAHRQGVVHRDIKPANVMIDAVSGTVKVTDFGIARIANASRTRTGMVLGT